MRRGYEFEGAETDLLVCRLEEPQDDVLHVPSFMNHPLQNKRKKEDDEDEKKGNGKKKKKKEEEAIKIVTHGSWAFCSPSRLSSRLISALRTAS